ncbi:hypothetical protein [Rhizobium sp. EC-SD404]|uniref:anti-sigma factor family protein n=1 Tax=Rhizobium sp. EC-SD404 TaxID=2038389 RepID=UPI001252EE4E|nr:hypothetical protein [Rhizobium sp. EC-SD404]VVT25851.1 putative transmembrane anti-sigma factor [Rhizobium sp. EC-SD404]
MNDQFPDFETLSAYVDGELDAQHAAAIAALAARDPAIASHLAKIHQLRSAVSRLSSDVVVLPLPGSMQGRWGVRSSRWVAFAAAIACVVAGSLVTGPWLEFGEDSNAIGLESIISAHDDWLRTGRGQLLSASLPESQTVDLLAAAGLVQVHYDERQMIGGVDMTHSGFVGAKGCRLSLFRGSLAVKEAAITGEISDGDLHVASWTGGAFRYVVVARSMDEGRFALVVDALRQATGNAEGRARDVIAALEGARQPCMT